jgi:hypothetical protein
LREARRESVAKTGIVVGTAVNVFVVTVNEVIVVTNVVTTSAALAQIKGARMRRVETSRIVRAPD